MAKRAVDTSTAQHHAPTQSADQDRAQLPTADASLRQQVPNRAHPTFASILDGGEARAVRTSSARQATSISALPDADASTRNTQAAAIIAPSASHTVTVNAGPEWLQARSALTQA